MEDILFTPLTELRKPTAGELAVSGGTGLASGVGGEAFESALKQVTKTIKKIRPKMSDTQARKAAEDYIRNELGQFTGLKRKPTTKAPTTPAPYGTHTVKVRGGESFTLPNRYKTPTAKPATKGTHTVRVNDAMTGESYEFELPNKSADAEFYKDLRKELGLPEEGYTSEDIPLGLSIKKVSREEGARLRGENPTQANNLDEILASSGYSPEQIASISTKEKQRIINQNIPPFSHKSFEQVSEQKIPTPETLEPEQVGERVAWSEFTESEGPKGIKRLFNRLFNPLNNAPEKVKQTANDWRREVLTARADANAIAERFANIPDEDGWKMVRYIQNPTKETAQRLNFDPAPYQKEIKELRQVYDQVRRAEKAWISATLKTTSTRFGRSRGARLPPR